MLHFSNEDCNQHSPYTISRRSTAPATAALDERRSAAAAAAAASECHVLHHFHHMFQSTATFAS
jgi:hypothetical protein